MSRLALVLASSMLLRVCGRNPSPPPPNVNAFPTAPGVNQPQAMQNPMQPGVTGAAMPTAIPGQGEHGGAVAVSGDVTAEVLSMANGQLALYARDSQRQPIVAYDLAVNVRKPDGTVQPVAMTYDPTSQAYVGRLVNVLPGQYPVQVDLQANQAAAPVQVITPPVTVTTANAAPPPRLGGRVEVVGNQAVEAVVTPSGNIAMYFYDQAGNPIPSAQLAVPGVMVTVNGQTTMVPTVAEEDHLSATPGAPPGSTVYVTIPRTTVMGVPFYRLGFANPLAIPVLPPEDQARARAQAAARENAPLPPGVTQRGLVRPPPPPPGQRQQTVSAPPPQQQTQPRRNDRWRNYVPGGWGYR